MYESILEKLTEILNVNKNEAYLHFEKIQDKYKIWIIERGTGGCTFPSMEILKEATFDEEIITKLCEDKSLIHELQSAKGKIAKDNPYFYDTVFRD